MRRRNEKVAVLLAGAAITLAMTGCGGDKFTLTNETVTVELGSEPSDNVTDYVTFKDGVSDNKKQEILDNTVLDFSDVDMSKVGDYTATITYDKTSFTFTVEVQDTTAPVGTLANEIAEIQTGDEVKAADLVTGVEDAQDVTVEFVTSTLESVDFDTEAQAEEASEDADTEATEETAEEASSEDAEDAESEESVEGEADTTEAVIGEETAKAHTFDVAGKYEIVIRLTDASGNKTELTQRIVVTDPDTTAPEISGVKNLSVTVGNTPDYLKGVTATDDVDGDVTDKITVDSSAVDVNKAGTYKVIYKVADAAGNETTKEAKVTVAAKKVAQTATTTTNGATTAGGNIAAGSSSGGSSAGSSNASTGGSSSSSNNGGGSSSGSSSGGSSSSSGSSSSGGASNSGSVSSSDNGSSSGGATTPGDKFDQMAKDNNATKADGNGSGVDNKTAEDWGEGFH